VFSCAERKAPNVEVAHWSQFEPARLNAHNAPRPPRVAAKISEEDAEERRVATRLDAIQAAEVFDDSKSLIVLAHALSDPSSEVKEAALGALTEKSGTDVTQAIRRGLKDADPEFRMEVLEALAEQGDLESLHIAKVDPSDEVRERAAELLEGASD
jgi:HEAT repeat protein